MFITKVLLLACMFVVLELGWMFPGSLLSYHGKFNPRPGTVLAKTVHFMHVGVILIELQLELRVLCRDPDLYILQMSSKTKRSASVRTRHSVLPAHHAPVAHPPQPQPPTAFRLRGFNLLAAQALAEASQKQRGETVQQSLAVYPGPIFLRSPLPKKKLLSSAFPKAKI